MNAYSIALFLHVVGALGFFATLGIEWTSMRQLRRAGTAEQARESLSLASSTGRIAGISMVTLLASGIYMTATAWGGAGWVIVTLGAMVALGVFTGALGGRRTAALKSRLASESGPLSPEARQLIEHPVLRMVTQTRVAVGLGIIFLMTVKPDPAGSLITIGVAFLVGIISALPMQRQEQPQNQPAN